MQGSRSLSRTAAQLDGGSGPETIAVIAVSLVLAKKYGGSGLSFGAAVPALATVAVFVVEPHSYVGVALVWWLLFLGALALTVLGVRKNRLLLGITGALMVAGIWLFPTYVLCLLLAHS